jgi:hypothetical protein
MVREENVKWIDVVDSAVQAVGRDGRAVGGLAETALVGREVADEIVVEKIVAGGTANKMAGLA